MAFAWVHRSGGAFVPLHARLQPGMDRKKSAMDERAAAASADASGGIDGEGQLRALIDAVPLALVIEDMAGGVRAWNTAAERMFGWGRAEALGRRLPHLTDAGRAEAAVRRERVLAGENVLDFEIECVRRDGARFFASLSSGRLVDRTGAATGLLSLVCDISERKRAERQFTLQMELTRILSECDSADEAVPRVIAAYCEVQGWACGARWSRADVTGLLRCLETWHAPQDAASAAFMAETLQTSVPLTAAPPLLGRAWHTDEAQWVPDLAADAHAAEHPAARAAGLRSAMAFRVTSGGETFGVIGLYGHAPAAHDRETAHLARQFGAQLGLFVARREEERTLQFVASHDVLTGLPNRVMFAQRLGQALAQAQRYGRKPAVLFVDLDRFKFVNDTLGHDAGDRLLRDVAERLRDSLREGDTVGRHGGDEFVVLIDQYDAAAQVAGVAQKIIDQLGRPFVYDGQEFHISASIGIAVFPNDGRDGHALMQHADMAMYRAKSSGKSQYQFYSPYMNRNSLDRRAMDVAMRAALAEGQFVLYFQPKYAADGRRLVALEALVRWARPGGGLLEPSDFLPFAEDSDTAVAIGEFVLRAACAEAARWGGGEPVRVCVNVSARHFFHGRLLSGVETVLRETGLPGDLLELEVTEPMLLQDPERATRLLGNLRALGVRVALDDFGTGYSSLGYLRRFPLDAVKVDRSFVGAIPADVESMSIVRAVIAMAHSLRLRVVGEGVETEEQARFLRIHACDEMQGYHLGRVASADDVRTLLAAARDAGQRKA